MYKTVPNPNPFTFICDVFPFNELSCSPPLFQTMWSPECLLEPVLLRSSSASPSSPPHSQPIPRQVPRQLLTQRTSPSVPPTPWSSPFSTTPPTRASPS